MAFSGNNPHLFRWKRLSSATKKPDKNGGNDLWKKRVEMASEFAVSQVFAHKKPNLGSRGLAVPLHSTEQLRDHDEDYSEAQALLSNWLSSKLRIDLEIEDEDDLMSPDDEGLPAANLNATLSHANFDDFCLSDEEKHSGVNNILQELKQREVLDSVMMEKLLLDEETTPKKFRDPVLTMEARHRQVRENRLQREAEKERQRREKEARQAVRQEAKRREREQEMRRKQEQCKQEELVQQELVRLRREMEQRRAQEQRARQRKRSELHQAAANTQTAPAHLTKQQQNTEQLRREEGIQAKIHTSNFKELWSQRLWGRLWWQPPNLVVDTKSAVIGPFLKDYSCDLLPDLDEKEDAMFCHVDDVCLPEEVKTDDVNLTPNCCSMRAFLPFCRKVHAMSGWKPCAGQHCFPHFSAMHDLLRKLLELQHPLSTGADINFGVFTEMLFLHQPRERDQSGQGGQISSHLEPKSPNLSNGQILNGECLQRHFCGWHSAVLERQLQMRKAAAFLSWRRQLRAWRAWRAVVCAEQRHRDVAKTEEELRTQNRKDQLAVKSDRRRLLRRCLYEWQVWCRIMREQRCILAQQQETKRRMTVLLSAAAKGHLKTKRTPADQPQVMQPELGNQTETSAKKDQNSSEPSSPGGSMIHQDNNATGTASGPLQPWQVTRRHTAPTAEDIHKARQWVEDFPSSTASTGSRFESRHALQQQIITQQRKLLQEQQEQIARLKEKQNMKDLRLEMEKTMHYAPVQRAPAGDVGSQSAPSRKAVTRQTCPHPIVTAMEVRARQRAERRKEIEEVKKKKEEEKLAEMKAAEERRQQEEEEEKRQALEKRREEKRLEREREEEKQRQRKRQQELARLAHQHCNRTLLLQRGLAPWKRFIQFLQVNKELADNHHRLLLLRRCTLQWQQSARESVSQKNARADLLQQHFLLRRGFRCWMTLRDLQLVQEERAERFHRRHTLRRFLQALLDYVTQERLVERERQELAQRHSNRRLQQRCFLAWRQLPWLMRRERERNARREKLIRRVAQVLPDFHSHPS